MINVFKKLLFIPDDYFLNRNRSYLLDTSLYYTQGNIYN